MDLEPSAPTSPSTQAATPDAAIDELWFEITGERQPPPPPPKPSGTFDIELKVGEPLAVGVQRVCLYQFDVALYGLRHQPDRAKGVHEARKATKRIRAMLRLVRDAIGYPIYRAENVVLRDVARVLSPVRSSHVIFALADDVLSTVSDQITPEAAAHLLAELDGRRHENGLLVLDRQLMMDLATTLLCARSRFATWPLIDTNVDAVALPRHRIADSFDSVAGGVHRVYQRGRKAMRVAEEMPSIHSFHLWRKRAKYLRHQIEALHLVWPPVLDGLAAALEELSEALGVEHDYAELGQLLTGEPWLLPDDRGRPALLAHIAQRRLELQRKALAAGARLYHETPDAFIDRLRSYWDARIPG